MAQDPTAPTLVEAPVLPPAVARRRRRSQGGGRPIWMERPSAITQILKGVVIALIVLVMLYPFIYVLASSLASDRSQASGEPFPTSFSLGAYRMILGGSVVQRAMVVSFGITAVGTTLSVLFTAMLAYGLTRTKDVPGARACLMLVIATMFFGAGMIPSYLLVKYLGMINSWWSLIIPGLISAFNMIVLRNAFMSLPQEIFEAARIDGASEWRIFWRIVLPLSKATVAVIAIFCAVGYWNSFFNAMLYLNDSTKWPIQNVLQQYVTNGQTIPGVVPPDRPPPPAYTLRMAIVVIATVPILLVYPFAQRHFTKGMITGAVKG